MPTGPGAIDTEPEDFTVHPVRAVAVTDAVATVAKVVAVAAVQANNHRFDPAWAELLDTLDSRLQSRDVGAPLPMSDSDARSAAERLGMILNAHRAAVGWGKPKKDYGDRRRPGRPSQVADA